MYVSCMSAGWGLISWRLMSMLCDRLIIRAHDDIKTEPPVSRAQSVKGAVFLRISIRGTYHARDMNA